jgi:hypothetical protein
LTELTGLAWLGSSRNISVAKCLLPTLLARADEVIE